MFPKAPTLQQLQALRGLHFNRQSQELSELGFRDEAEYRQARALRLLGKYFAGLELEGNTETPKGEPQNEYYELIHRIKFDGGIVQVKLNDD